MKLILLFLLLMSILPVATPYSPFRGRGYPRDCPGCTGYTAWRGLPADPWNSAGVRIMAVDPKVLKLGRCYDVRFIDPDNLKPGHTTLYLAADIGGDIKGRRTDFLMKSRKSMKQFGVQDVAPGDPVACPKSWLAWIEKNARRKK